MNQFRQQYAFMWLLFFIVAISGCTSNPFKVAETPGQKVYALERSYNIVLLSALDLINDPNVSQPIKKSIRQAEGKTTPIFDNLSKAFSEYTIAKVMLEQGTTTADKVNIVAANLDKWLIEAEQAILELSNVVTSGGGL